ncbi:MAG TPA: cyclic-di-AMP receptor [Thermomicrobiaceae bacterium]|nr:cyclic-di-AMP receptor [Thermomicrobiaceae bacterium]
MKLVVAVVQEEDAEPLLDALVGAGVGATLIASTGSLLHRHHAAVLVGARDAAVWWILQRIGSVCHERMQVISPIAGEVWALLDHFEVRVGGATVFVLPVERFERIGVCEPSHRAR